MYPIDKPKFQGKHKKKLKSSWVEFHLVSRKPTVLGYAVFANNFNNISLTFSLFFNEQKACV